jgi:osmotically-inducible protein OsmY
MKSDSEIKQDVWAELRWSPEIDDEGIYIEVTGGAVRLGGHVPSYFTKHGACSAAKRVAGVTEVIDSLTVELPPCEALTDHQIEKEAAAAVKAELPMCWQSIKAAVHAGRLVLEGTVQWNYQRERAEIAACRVRGVVSVENWIELKPHVHAHAHEVRHQIQQALRRSAELDASQITIEASGSDVTLKGEVRSWAERDRAQSTAWCAPGIRRVWNELIVRASSCLQPLGPP